VGLIGLFQGLQGLGAQNGLRIGKILMGMSLKILIVNSPGAEEHRPFPWFPGTSLSDAGAF
jgi:hypothetical protein